MERSGDLSNSDGGQRHATERETQTSDLDERVRDGRRENRTTVTPSAGDECGQTVERGEESDGDRVSGSGEEPHPHHGREEPSDAENESDREATTRVVGAVFEAGEHGDPDEGQRPPTPRRH
ncbi:MAG: hypothetical protein EBX99_07910 [Acidimicrobiia bacterium]|nr:hypothetical protein [Acidimicrobiia bacterium]